MNENNFSYWFPRIKDCGIPVPDTYVHKIDGMGSSPEANRLYEAFYMENIKEDQQVIEDYVEKHVLPELKTEKIGGHIFVKNATFSGKFRARECCNQYGTHGIARAIAAINYDALCVGAGGADEIVVRNFIEYDRQKTPCIYEGLPLRTEFRVFYDFDEKKVLFSVNYWDYDTVYPRFYEATDRIIFEHEWEKLDRDFKANKARVEKVVEDAMKNVKGMNGAWSVDILKDESDHLWLIDMATARTSAYWNMRPGQEEK